MNPLPHQPTGGERGAEADVATEPQFVRARSGHCFQPSLSSAGSGEAEPPPSLGGRNQLAWCLPWGHAARVVRRPGFLTATLAVRRADSLALYIGDHQDQYPGRNHARLWSEQLRRYFDDPHLLLCPSDRETLRRHAEADAETDAGEPSGEEPRSYLMNGFDDFFQTTLSVAEWKGFTSGQLAATMPESAVQQGAETITFGEKQSASHAPYLNLFLPEAGYLNQMEESRHPANAVGTTAGRSNFLFAEGSVRAIQFGHSTCPINQWAVTAQWRTNAALCRQRY